jgi:RecB family exonuclease
MAEHVRNQLARDGLLLRKNTVSTLSRFLDEIPAGLKPASRAHADETLREILAAHCPAEYAPIRDSRALRSLLREACESLALAGAEALAVPGAVGQVYAALLDRYRRQGWALRGDRLRAATEYVDQKQWAAGTLLFDGFYDFAPRELAFLEALSKQNSVLVSLATLEAGENLRRAPIEVQSYASREQEALAIAASVAALIEKGVEARRIGILVRNPSLYVPLFENVFSRLAIPSRSYLGRPLAEHPLTLFLRKMREAASTQWEAGATLEAIRTNLTGLASSEEGDWLEWRLREAMPASAAAHLQKLVQHPAWNPQLSSDWLAAPANLDDDEATAHRWRELSDALRLFERILPEAADWEAVEAEIEGQKLRERDRRRQVVHLMDLHEARQWELDYVFAPGFLEGEFPMRPQPDPLLSEETRAALGMKTLRDREKEEELLWRVLCSRATQRLTLSFPRANEKGDPLSPSPYWTGETVVCHTRLQVAAAAPRPAALLGHTQGNYRRERAWNATEFESYLSCPFQHFARYGLNLQPLPALPAERLDALLLGTVAHEALRRWTADGGMLVSVAERVYEEQLRQKRIPPGYRVELERLNLLRYMRLYAENSPAVPPGWTAHLEEQFEFEIPATADSPPVRVRGQIDRYDLSPDGRARAFDYKYSKATGLEEKYVQGGLYALALRAMPNVNAVESFSYVALREDARLTTFEGPALQAKLEQIETEARATVRRVAGGEAPVAPKDRANCTYCDFQDVCRIRSQAAAVDEEEAATA